MVEFVMNITVIAVAFHFFMLGAECMRNLEHSDRFNTFVESYWNVFDIRTWFKFKD